MKRIVTGSIICLFLTGLPFLSACRCIPCISAPYHDVLVKSDGRARDNVTIVDKFADKPVTGQRGIASQAVHDAHRGDVKIAADINAGQPRE
jgi:hypothetical protein